VKSTSFNPTNSLLATASSDGKIHVYKSDSTFAKSIFTSLSIESIVFTTDTQLCVASRDSSFLKYFDVEEDATTAAFCTSLNGERGR